MSMFVHQVTLENDYNIDSFVKLMKFLLHHKQTSENIAGGSCETWPLLLQDVCQPNKHVRDTIVKIKFKKK